MGKILPLQVGAITLAAGVGPGSDITHREMGRLEPVRSQPRSDAHAGEPVQRNGMRALPLTRARAGLPQPNPALGSSRSSGWRRSRLHGTAGLPGQCAARFAGCASPSFAWGGGLRRLHASPAGVALGEGRCDAIR